MNEEGMARLVQAVINGFIEIIKSNLVFKNDQIRQFSFPPFRISHHIKGKLVRKNLRIDYNNRKVEALKEFDKRRVEWLRYEREWTLRDGFWCNVYGELFEIDPQRIKNGLIEMIDERIKSYSIAGTCEKN